MKKKQFLTLPTLPNSIIEPLQITSPHTGRYNCIAWALGITDTGFWPDFEDEDYSWPADLPKIASIENFIHFFQKHGFEICENARPGKGIEKIVLFEKDGQPTHAARQLKNDLWTSKVGILEDVRHSLSAISGGMYGEVSVFMKRRKPV